VAQVNQHSSAKEIIGDNESKVGGEEEGDVDRVDLRPPGSLRCGKATAEKLEVTARELEEYSMPDATEGAVQPGKTAFHSMTREKLLLALEMFAKNWLAHDGCWFLAAEESLGMDAAIALDTIAWQRFAATEANRIMTTFGILPAGGLGALERALGLRQYSLINSQRTEWSEDGKRLRLFMDVCRVQETRRRKGLPDFPCKPVGTVEFETFARTVDPRIHTTCLHCPPESPDGKYCGWEFRLNLEP
jgi:hypothetical protein